MERSITGFHRDDENDWVAELDCGHGQHVRHRPPFFNRPWVVTESGRNEKLGLKLDCVRCDRREMPETASCYQSTPVFSEKTLPAALLKQHTTATGTWARVIVTAGEIGCRIHEPVNQHFQVTPAHPGIIPPEITHCLEPRGAVELYIEFYRLQQT
ncbi:MAG: DUF3565 domain-containing protein [Gammaproteobacteria bacterium]|nr:DUF3565 domain-containing protein [Gammaproteobacteria bacterium]